MHKVTIIQFGLLIINDPTRNIISFMARFAMQIFQIQQTIEAQRREKQGNILLKLNVYSKDSEPCLISYTLSAYRLMNIICQ